MTPTALDHARWLLARAEARGSEIVRIDRAELAKLVALAAEAEAARRALPQDGP